METIQTALGLGVEGKDLGTLQVTLRAIIVFMAALVMVRLSAKRFLGRHAVFDAILGFILASMLSRGINGSAGLVPTIVGGFALVGVHRLLAMAAFHSHKFGLLIKGGDDVLIENGSLKEGAMRRNHITKTDLLEDIRLRAELEGFEEVKFARLERNGAVSVIPKKS